MKSKIIKFLATGFGSGLAPKAPGTWGTAAAALFFYCLFTAAPSLAATPDNLPFAVLFVAASVLLCDAAQRSVFEGKDDPRAIVLDEFAGFLVAMFGWSIDIKTLIAAFIFFRFFDILKPFPVRYFEKLPGGAGIVLDDVVAGLLANLALCILALFWPNFFLAI